ncbi:MAG: DUF4258 domain-containing protein [Chlorobiales bacterium]|jgi:hypothetical protein|nr:DUF4258 domain-containing protein [Chlorobiales bacterium]
MTDGAEYIEKIKEAANKKLLFLPHAVRQMSRPDRMISAEEVRQVIQTGVIVEDYPDDVRGRSCLVLGGEQERPIHVVCAPKEDYLAIITAYLPGEDFWEDNFRRRKKI